MDSKKLVVAVIIPAIVISGIIVYNADSLYLKDKKLIISPLPEKLICNAKQSIMVFTRNYDGSIAKKEKVEIGIEKDGKYYKLYEGYTDENGILNADIKAPDVSGKGKILIKAGKSILKGKIELKRNYRLIIYSDKPIYKPGQIIHVRLLAFEGMPPKPSNESIEVILKDPDGNSIFKKILNGNEYGISSVDIPLAKQLPLGNYKIVATIGGEEESLNIRVDEYVLPKFKIELRAKPWYRIDEEINGSIIAKYFWNKPIEGNVTIEAYVYLGIWDKVFSCKGRLINGKYDFSIKPIEYAVGLPIEKNNGLLRLKVKVEDNGGHVENKTYNIPIAKDSILLSILADKNVIGMNSSYYFIASSPDGIPLENVKISLYLNDELKGETITDERGVASIKFPYKGEERLKVIATKGEEKVVYEYSIEACKGIKVMGDKIEYNVGDIAYFKVFSNENGSKYAYYEVYANGVILKTGRVRINENFSFTITNDMLPMAEIRVYQILYNLDIVKDVYTFGVKAPANIKLKVYKDKEKYEPKENLKLRVITDENESIAIGLKIVDKSVYELQERNFLDLYFDLEREFLKPRYEIHAYIFNVTSLPKEYGYFEKGFEEERNDLGVYKTKAIVIKEKAVLTYWSVLLLSFLSSASFIIAHFAINVFGKKRFFISLAIIITIIGGICLAYTYNEKMVEYGKEHVVTFPEELGWGLERDNVLMAFDINAKAIEYEGEAENIEEARTYFPETWEWIPFILINGSIELNLTVPDSITTWELEIFASSLDGRIGIKDDEIEVFKEFFIEPDIPISAIRGDEFNLRVLIYNYGNSGDVKVNLIEDNWFEILSPLHVTKYVEGNSVSSVTFKIKPIEVGKHKVHLVAYCNGKKDEIIKEIKIVPDGKKVEIIKNGMLHDNQSFNFSFYLPPERIEGGDNAYIKIQPGMQSIIIDGAESFIKFVSGCGEQSLSMLSVDILAYQNLMKKGMTDEQYFKYESMIIQGIQHELMYLKEDENGRGIVWFPQDEKPHPWLTSWGLITFQDAINADFEIDENIIKDMQSWLISKQNEDGSFEFPEWGLYETTNPILKAKKIASTAYITRALLYSGYEGREIDKSLKYIEENVFDNWNDSYTLALCLIALEYGKGNYNLRNSIADRLMELRKEDEQYIWWEANYNIYSNCDMKNMVETTAYAIMALHMHGKYVNILNKAIKYLLDGRIGGGFFSTQDTVVALQAINSIGMDEIKEMKIKIFVDGIEIENFSINETNKIMHIISLNEYIGNKFNVKIDAKGEGKIIYQICIEYYLPWNIAGISKNDEILLNVEYNVTRIRVNDTILAKVEIIYNGSAKIARMVLIDLRCPVGFSFITGDFEELVRKDVIDNYEIRDRQALIYLESIERGKKIEFSYRLKANMPIKGLIQGVKAYDMYNPNLMDEEEPTEIIAY